jgi:glutamate synthase (NADPH/NADH) large chain
MTGGRAIILGRTGRNFAAGMSGGIAYVYDPDDLLPGLVNSELVDLERPDADEGGYLRSMVAEHRDRTGSRRAEELLGDFDGALSCFVKVMPRDYKKVLNRRKAEEKLEAVHG